MHRELMKKLFIMEFDLLGECNVHELVDDKTHSVEFSEAEIAEVQRIRDEAWRDYHLRAAGADV